MAALPGEPESIGEVLDRGFRLFGAGFFRTIGLLLLPYFAMGLLVAVLVSTVFLREDSDPARWLQPLSLTLGASAFLMLLAYLWISAAVVYRYGTLARGAPATLGSAVRAATRRFPAVLVAAVLYTLALVTGLLLLILPGLVLMISMAFFLIGIMLDDWGMAGAVLRSHRLVWGNWWRTAAVLSVPMLLALAVPVALNATGTLLHATPEPLRLAWSLLEFVVNAVLQLLLTAVMVVHYQDLLLRSRGDDLERRLDAAYIP